MKRFENLFEWILWDSRFIVLSAVIASLFISIAMFYMASVDSYYVISHLGEYASSTLTTEERNTLRSSTITHVVEIIDGFLLGTVLLIFSLGLYELFISKIDMAVSHAKSSNVLLISSLDDLKNRLAKVILMILIVKYFEHAIRMPFETPLDLLSLAAGITLIGLAIYISHAGSDDSSLAKKMSKKEEK